MIILPYLLSVLKALYGGQVKYYSKFQMNHLPYPFLSIFKDFIIDDFLIQTLLQQRYYFFVYLACLCPILHTLFCALHITWLFSLSLLNISPFLGKWLFKKASVKNYSQIHQTTSKTTPNKNYTYYSSGLFSVCHFNLLFYS